METKVYSSGELQSPKQCSNTVEDTRQIPRLQKEQLNLVEELRSNIQKLESRLSTISELYTVEPEKVCKEPPDRDCVMVKIQLVNTKLIELMAIINHMIDSVQV